MLAALGSDLVATLVAPGVLPAFPVGARVEVPVTRAIVAYWRAAAYDSETGVWTVDFSDSPLLVGEYNLVWRDSGPEPPEFEVFVPLAVSAGNGSGAPLPPGGPYPWSPTVEEIAVLLPAYTRGGFDDDRESAGAEQAMFTSSTSPTADEVEAYIVAACDEVQGRVGVVIPLGPEPMAPVAPAPVAPSCADMDDDGDGVNNCNDKCPGSQAGQTIGPDGCPVPVSIDLKGVNFDFDKATLRPDAVSILNEAIEILKRYPDLKVEVAGHTDSIGSDAYNQKLSERRAKTVYDYLTSNGVDAARLVGPTGYGESRPIAPNTNPDGSDNPEGRAQNRRTELNVQNQ